MDGGGKMIESLCEYLESIMALTYIQTEKYNKISEAYKQVNVAKIWVEFIYGLMLLKQSSPYVSICKVS